MTATRLRGVRGSRRQSARGSSEAGSIAAFAVLIMVALLALLGLVIDGGSALTAHQAAEVEAEQAARAGAGELDVDALRQGVLEIDQPAAVAAAEQFATAAGHTGTASVSGDVVTVRIHYRLRTAILGIVGVSTLPVSAVASAEDLSGVTQGSP